MPSYNLIGGTFLSRSESFGSSTGGENSMLIPVLMLFLLGLGVPMFSMILGFTKETTALGWIAIMLVSVAAIVGAVVIYVIARLQRRPEE